MAKGAKMNFQLRQLREKSQFKTRDALALATGFSVRRIQSWENGERRPTLEDACVLADVLGCTLDELAGRELSPREYSDERQATLNELYSYLDDANKSAAVGAVRGIAAAQAEEKTTAERAASGARQAV